MLVRQAVNSDVEQPFLTIYAIEGRMRLFMSVINKQDLLIDSTFGYFPFILEKNMQVPYFFG